MRQKQSRDLSQSENEENEISEKQLIEFEELTDELLFVMNQYTSSCDKGNLAIDRATSFNFEIAIDINSLSGDPKTIADIIIEAVQNADEYKWKYVYKSILLTSFIINKLIN